jgi:hypothetical protein
MGGRELRWEGGRELRWEGERKGARVKREGGGYMSYEEEDTCHMRRRVKEKVEESKRKPICWQARHKRGASLPSATTPFLYAVARSSRHSRLTELN